MIPTSKHVKDVYLGKHSVLEGLKSMDQDSIADTLCLDESTIEQSASIEVATRIRQLGAEMVDAPVSGGKFRSSSMNY
jgi:3-hydroxyisobutyrate dehydrogenase